MSLQKSRFHFVGVGGIGMCGLAELLHNMGAQVSGSDLAENANTDRLKNMGVQIFKGHRSENVGDVDVVVYTSAAPMNNPELMAARARQIPLIPRAEALAEIMRLKRGLAVGGTHGKTTTTAMVASIFLGSGAKPTIMVGGRLPSIQSTALLGDGDWIIVEADESDGSFSKLSPEIAIVTNIDSDHLDYYKTVDNLQRAFQGFGQRVPFYGALVVCGDDPLVRQTFEHFSKRIFFYGFDEKNDYVVRGEKGRYSLHHKGKKLGDFELPVPGQHNALNATAALVASLGAGISFEDGRKGLANFHGVDRRFQHKGQAGGVDVYDDYGHHPTEVRATLQGFRERFPDRRVVVYFQPHRYSRTQFCWNDFTQCFSQCDQLFIADIYPAGEAPIEGITAERLAREIQHPPAHYLPKQDPVAVRLRENLKSGDVFVTLGAGDGWKVGLEVLELLRKA